MSQDIQKIIEELKQKKNPDGAFYSQAQIEAQLDIIVRFQNLELDGREFPKEETKPKIENKSAEDLIYQRKTPQSRETQEIIRTLQSEGVEIQEELSNLQNYLLLPETNDHPDLLIAKNRLAYDTGVDKVAKVLGLNLSNNSQGYIGNINWNQALDLNKSLGNFTLNPSLFAEFLKLLKSGDAFDGKRNKISSSELEKILNDITEKRDPWRSEWLDSKYSTLLNYVNFNKFVNGELRNVTETLTSLSSDTLMQDKIPGIDLEDWINNPTLQGLPRKTVKNGTLYYWKPQERKVARFDAFAGRAYLCCNWGPLSSGADLGVRAAKKSP